MVCTSNVLFTVATLHSSLKSRSARSIRVYFKNYRDTLLPRSIRAVRRLSTGSIVAGRDQLVFSEGCCLFMSFPTWTLKSLPNRWRRLRNKRLLSTYEVGTICSFQWCAEGLGERRELLPISVVPEAALLLEFIIFWWNRWLNRRVRREVSNVRGKWKKKKKKSLL
jgi:hypothetical protein